MEDLTFEPKVLQWARIRGLGDRTETLNFKIGTLSKIVTSEDIIKWEAGLAQPTFSDIQELARIYKRPLAVFFLNSPPEEIDNPIDRRSAGSKYNEDISPKGLLIIRKARKIQLTTAALYSELDEKPSFKFKKYTTNTDPEVLAKDVRNDLSLSLQDQFKFRKFEDFFEYLRTKIEDTGVITLKCSLNDVVPIEDYRAFSFADKEPYLIMVNNKDYEGAKVFSLAHEFAHILLRQAGVCNNFKSFDYQGNKVDELEVFCNEFAANLLVPKDDFLKNNALKNKNKILFEELESIVKNLALSFKVSRVVILRRLLTLNFIDSSTYKAKISDWDSEVLSPRKKGGSFSLKTILQKNGKTYSSLIFEAYDKNKISYSNISEYLGINRRYVSKFRELLHDYVR